MITTEVVIARHGQAVCNTLGIVGGEQGCTGLTDLGQFCAADEADVIIVVMEVEDISRAKEY
jgi:broad specificity phosphatase PhoE